MGGKKEYELMLEIGHKSAPLNKKLPNGYTHKWTAFVRGVDNSKIEHCVSHVVFQLHESFDDPYRDISEPPFQIKETGYAGFEIPITIYFKNKDKPNELQFVHDLTLLNNKTNNHTTVEKIKFISPNRDFERYLIKSGAKLLPVVGHQPRPEHRRIRHVKRDRCESPPAKKQKSLIPSKDMSQHQKPSSSFCKFVDIFGKPIVYSQNQKDPLMLIQSKIASLDDDRLQKIVDIVEDAGEWFNVTSSKFEFDLKRLDEKTLKIIGSLIDQRV